MLVLPIFTLLATLTTALPLKSLTASSILKAAPGTSSCANPPAPGECRTAVQAAPYIALSYTNFGITTFGEQAAILALMLYESGDFKYSINHYPGVAGQGTRNMQSPAYNAKYAEYLATVCRNCGISAEDVAQATSPSMVLELVNTDQWGFGSAAWFLSTQCEDGVREGLKAGTLVGWEAYVQECVGTTVTEDRTKVWRDVMALGSW